MYVTTLGGGLSQHLRRPRCTGCMGGVAEVEPGRRVYLSSLRESGIGLARPAAPPAPLSRASLLDAMRGLGSLRREDALPPDATAVQGVQVSRSRPANEIIAVLRIKAQRIWPVRATD